MKKTINIYINNQIPFKDHVISRKYQISEQTVKWERQWINEYPNIVSLKILNSSITRSFLVKNIIYNKEASRRCPLSLYWKRFFTTSVVFPPQ